jgi:hypothetical protein
LQGRSPAKIHDKKPWENLLEMQVPRSTLDVEGLRRQLLGRIINQGPDSRAWRQGTLKMAQLDPELSARSARRMFWIAMVSLGVTVAVAGVDIFLPRKGRP